MQEYLNPSFIKLCATLGIEPKVALFYIIDVVVFNGEINPNFKNNLFFNEERKLKVRPLTINWFKPSKATSTLYKEIYTQINEYRHLFKDIPRTSAIGDKTIVAQKLTTFLSTHTQYTFEDIIEAAKRHISTEGQYASDAGNFIQHKTNGSKLLTLLESEELQSTKEDSFYVV